MASHHSLDMEQKLQQQLEQEVELGAAEIHTPRERGSSLYMMTHIYGTTFALPCHTPLPSPATPPSPLPRPQTALQLLEKSVQEKQDSVATLRRKQLEEMKAANLKMQNQLNGQKWG